jgi:uncharacterized protein YutE (UPF0331/DUF86 family)
VDIEADRLQGKLDHIAARVAQLRETRGRGHDAFAADRVLIDASVRRLQTAVEAAIDAALHVVVRENLGKPRDHGDAFRLLGQVGVLSEDLLPNLLAMVRFRNLAVHLYAEVDDEMVWSILESDLVDLDRFVAVLSARYLPPGRAAQPTT